MQAQPRSIGRRARLARRWLAGALILAVLAGCRANQADGQSATQSVPAAPGEVEGSLQVGGQERTYLLHLPPAYPDQAALPLVLVLHGGGGNASNAATMSGMSAKADQAGFIVAYPNGSGRQADRLLTWNAGTCCGAALDQNIDDVGFIRALIQDLEGRYKVDPKRIYVTGMSNGAMMTYRLACELADTIAAAAPVAGALNTPECRPAGPLPLIIFHGTADQHVLYEGGAPRQTIDNHQRTDASVADAVTFWVGQDGCAAGPDSEAHGNIIKESYTACQAGSEVVLYSIQGGGHAWPGGQRGSRLGDEPTQEISATDLMWEFFARHPRP
jgi:polyhydroxybutyrate depolymerase